MFTWLADWWDGVELWLAQQPFAIEFALVMVVLLPLCLGLARLIDRVVDRVSARLTGVRDVAEPDPVEPGGTS
ncbi:hypothetical protein F0L68_02945 [Solihabitans fulvus]|uniref:Uncharacterized protein n=1 Tax=Solihabitans fulvus TaxID=1892852 RepID=A0A5B2XT23_9PSEU|nr:hypothetical protein [Solihabitans fulvus]KAA2266092.1 hypothetical protein F0L68_02945 [Solihabitans fulvus]